MPRRTTKALLSHSTRLSGCPASSPLVSSRHQDDSFCVQQNYGGKSKSTALGGQTVGGVEPAHGGQGGIHIPQVPPCVVGAWQPPSGGLIHPQGKEDLTAATRAKARQRRSVNPGKRCSAQPRGIQAPLFPAMRRLCPQS